MAKKGVVLAWEAGHAQVLDTEGRFKTVRCRQQVEVGEEISLAHTPPMYLKYAVAACLLITLCSGIWFDNYALAYVALDLNPSLELGVNWRDKVVVVKALNDEAKAVLEAHDLVGQNVSDAVTGIVRETLQSLPQEANPVAVVSVTGKLKVDSIKEKVQNIVQEELVKEKKTSQVVGVIVSSTIRQEAKDAGVSPGQYALALKATEGGNTVTVEEIKNKGLEKAMEKAGAVLEKVGNDVSKSNGKGLGNVAKEVREKVTGKDKNNDKDQDKGNDKNPKKGK